jgi:16S rRNA C967 or C1407 C5-methylase (RsmB/RsmF family)/NOL1/NOP2/fmu family ribosome biogenesis protein
MVKLPQALLQSLEGIEGFDHRRFIDVHEKQDSVTSIRINPAKCSEEELKQYGWLNLSEKVSWSAYGYYLEKRPSFTFDPLFHAGCYYVQEASSMFLEQAMKQTVDLTRPIRVLDLCAAPGGKSTHMQSLISSDSLLVSNEVIRGRANVLTQNITKWGGTNVIVTNNDPQHFARLAGFFDVLVVDAPCSGSGLFRRDEEAIGEWSEGNVMLCCGRQKRILADALPALKEGGVLLYSTCSYSKEEDEDIAAWLAGEMDMENIPLPIEKDWGIVTAHPSVSGSEGYRFYPYHLKGEGFFMACFRKKSNDGSIRYKTARPEVATAKERAIVQPFLKEGDWSLLRFREELIALPGALLQDYLTVQQAMHVLYAGVVLGEVMKEKLVPHHALALSTILSPNICSTDLSYEQAIKYLQRADLNMEASQQGWQPVSFHRHNLGWINALKNRVNNYYPKEFRILKQSNDAASEI